MGEVPSSSSAPADSAQAMFERDNASRALGMKIVSMGAGTATVTMKVRADMVNGHDLCHGGLIFTLADTCFALACNGYGRATVAAGAGIDFIAPARLGDELTAIGKEQYRLRRSGIYDISVLNQAGECIAMFRGRSRELGASLP
jgi:acyl-CoA thioesterase